MRCFDYVRRILLRPIRTFLLCSITLMVVPGVLIGCLIDDPDQTLPEPSIRRCSPRVLDDADQRRQDEVDTYNFDAYQELNWQIRETVETFNCDWIDCLDPNSVEGAMEEPPPPLSPAELQLPEGVQLQLTEFDVFPELRCPYGTMPMFRPQYLPYVAGETAATSVQDFIENYQVVGVPDDSQRMYAGIRMVADNHGASAGVNSFGLGDIAPRTMSIYEMVVGCRDSSGELRQQVGLAIKRDKMNLGVPGDTGHAPDSLLRVDVEFLTNGASGAKVLDDYKGGWDTMHPRRGFTPFNGRPYAPGAVIPSSHISTIGGPQFETLFKIEFFNSGWWVAHNGNWLGFYPREAFDKAPPNQIEAKACEALWYLEMFALNPVPWPATAAGSGQYAETGFGNAASFRNPFYIGAEPAKLGYWPDTSSDVEPYHPLCYNKTPFTSGAPPLLERYFFADGPGAKMPGCAK